MSDSITSVVKSFASMATLGITDGLLGLAVDAPTMPKAPQGPDSMQTGQLVKEGSGATLDEEAEAKKNARRTARKGTSKFRIPLASTATGTTASGGSGLKI